MSNPLVSHEPPVTGDLMTHQFQRAGLHGPALSRLDAPVLFAPTMLLIHGHTRRTGPRGIGVQAVRAWDMTRPETLPDPTTVLGSHPNPSRAPARNPQVTAS